VSTRRGAARAPAALAVLACAACASGPVEPVVDLTPFAWTFSQVWLGATVIRFGYPDEPAPAAADAPPFDLAPAGPGATQRRLAAHRYECAREDRAPDAACTATLEFWLLELDPPLAEATAPALRARLESSHGAPQQPDGAFELVRDSRGREWCGRKLALDSGAGFSHYARPIDRRRALAVASFTTRAPDRVAARDLARDAIERAAIASPDE
jgi:hypothetical protein